MEYVRKLFSVNLKDYANIGIDFRINIFLLILAIATAVLGFVQGAKNSAIALSVKQLLRHGAFGEENAKSLKELGLHNSRSAKAALSGEGRLRRTVKRLGERTMSYEEYTALSSKEKRAALKKKDIDGCKFYIEAQRQEDAEHIYKYLDSSFIKSALGALIVFAIAFVLMIFMPDLLAIINEVIAEK